MAFLNFSTEAIGIDPGSEYLRIIKNDQLVFNELSQVSFDTAANVVSGLGNSIRTTSNDTILKPVNYAIADFHGFETLLRGAIKGISTKSLLPKSYKMHFAIPTSSSEIEKRVFRDSGEFSGAREVYMIRQNCCAALGMNLLMEQKHFILIDFGSSKLELTVFANSVPISVGVIKMGTRKIAQLIKNFLRRKYELTVSEHELDTMTTELQELTDEIRIQETLIKAHDIQNVVNNFFALVNDEFVAAIERVSGDRDLQKAMTAGVYFTGGGSKIDFLRNQIKLGSELKRTVSKDPLLDNVNGLKKVITDTDKFKNYMMV